MSRQLILHRLRRDAALLLVAIALAACGLSNEDRRSHMQAGTEGTPNSQMDQNDRANEQVLEGNPSQTAIGLWDESGIYRALTPEGEQFSGARDFRADCPITRAVFFCGEGYTQAITGTTGGNCPVYGCVRDPSATPPNNGATSPITTFPGANCPVLNAALICGPGKSTGIAGYTGNHCPIYSCLDDPTKSMPQGPTTIPAPVAQKCPDIDYRTARYCDPTHRDSCGNCTNTPSSDPVSAASCNSGASFSVAMPIACTGSFPATCSNEAWRYYLVDVPGPQDGQGAPGMREFCTNQEEVGFRACQWRNPRDVPECATGPIPALPNSTVTTPSPSRPTATGPVLRSPNNTATIPMPGMPTATGPMPASSNTTTTIPIAAAQSPICPAFNTLLRCPNGFSHDANGCPNGCNRPSTATGSLPMSSNTTTTTAMPTTAAQSPICPAFNTLLRCPNGFSHDTNGCPNGCNQPSTATGPIPASSNTTTTTTMPTTATQSPICPAFNTLLRCPNGFSHDANGCPNGCN